ncbi:MAG: hypothetical protein KAY29_01920 [Brevundimonas sp.]|nr:hypothetical protein [Brevundimonas sp.]
MSRRFSLWWALVPLVAAMAYQTLRITLSPDLPDTDGHFGLIGAMISAVLLFGGWPRKHWIGAGFTASAVVLGLGVANARYVAWLHEAGGVPAHWLLELSAVFIVLAVPAGLIAGATSALVCGKEWLRR